MDITEPVAPEPADTSKYFYPYQSSLNFYFGASLSSPDIGSVVNYGLFGFSYLWPAPGASHIETGGEGLTSGTSFLWIAYRTHFISTARLRPYWSAGLGIKIRPEQGIASFLEVRNTYLRGAVGVEWSVWEALSSRTELFVAPDFIGRGFMALTTGMSWAFD